MNESSTLPIIHTQSSHRCGWWYCQWEDISMQSCHCFSQGQRIGMSVCFGTQHPPMHTPAHTHTTVPTNHYTPTYLPQCTTIAHHHYTPLLHPPTTHQYYHTQEHQRILSLSLDCFYKNLPEGFSGDVFDYNFDHPDAFDWDAVVDTLTKLKEGRPVDIPQVCFVVCVVVWWCVYWCVVCILVCA